MADQSTFNESDYQRLDDRIQTLVSDGLVAHRKHALIYLFLSNKFYCQPFEINEAITDGGNDCGIDAVFIDRRGDDPVIHLIQSKVYESKRKARSAFPASAIEKAIRFFQIIKNPNADLEKQCNSQLQQKVHEIRHSVDKFFPTFKLWLISNGSACVTHDLSPFQDLLKKQESVDVEEFHLSEVVEFCLNAHSKRTNHTFFARDVGVIETGTSELRSAVGYISARELYELIRDIKDERKVDYSVFNLNVRGFLGLDNPVNREILRSATSRDNINFASFNNGITIVGSTLRVNRTASDRPKVGIKRMSIVNGAQTCHAIFEAMKDFYPDFSAFDQLSVLFRVFETDDPELISSIAVSTNNQNRISPRDLRANDTFQIKLEKQLAECSIPYQRKRSFSGEDERQSRALDALKAGQIILSYVYHDPARAKRDSDSIFTDFYGKIFATVDVPKLVQGLEWFEEIERKRQFIEDEIRIRGAYRTENTFVTYGVFHILMMCSLINPMAQGDERKRVIEQAIEIISKQIEASPFDAFYSFFRDTQQAKILRESASQPSFL